MASLVTGYQYDIFISYRQKDNKYDGWVTEFVENLKKELEATFKEEINLYFDINPHDGLLETHDVDASLKDKLKCLVFIPVISRTYCDPKSFAWEYEFKKFIELASDDQFGLKIILPNGNVSSRVLPVRIHELEDQDIKLCESLLGGVLRGVDFVYKSSGVNRPLRANEDYLQNNLNKICYRDQINKVANAIDGIIHSLTNKESINGSAVIFTDQLKNSASDKRRKSSAIPESADKRKPWKRVALILFFLILIAGIIPIYILLKKNDVRQSLAILPFSCQPNDSALIAKNDILVEIAMTKLHGVKNLTIRPKISTAQYRNTEKSLAAVSKELDANYLAEGSIRRDGEKIYVWIGLNDARKNKQLWAGEFLWDNDKISGRVSEIVINIASACNARVSADELKHINNDPTSNSIAYLDYISANVLSNNAWNFFNTEDIVTDSSGFRKAINQYDKALRVDTLFAEAFARRAIAESWGFYTGLFDTSYLARCRSDIEKALKINKELPDAQVALGFYYLYCETDYQKSLVHFNRASILDPENYQPLFYMALVYRRIGDWGKSQSLISRVIRQNPQVPLFLTNIGLSYAYLHKFDSALIYHQNAIDILPTWSAPYENKIETILLNDGNISKARKTLDLATRNTGKRLSYLRIRLDIYDGELRKALNEASQSNPNEYRIKAQRLLLYARIYTIQKNRKAAENYYDSALVNLSSEKENKNVPEIHSLIAIANAGKGNREKAIEEAKTAVDMAIRNRMDESDMKLTQAEVYTMIGDYDNAIINIEYLLENPSCFSVFTLRLDPVWLPLLNLGEIQKLIAKH